MLCGLMRIVLEGKCGHSLSALSFASRVLTVVNFMNGILESELSKKIGVSRSVIKGHRNRLLKHGEHWQKKGRANVYSEEGASLIMEAAGVPTPPDEIKAIVDDSEAKKGDAEELTYVHAKFANTRVIKARRESGEVVIVRVKTSENFRPADHRGNPMTFPARCEGGVWVIARPLPRWAGKW